MDRKDVDDLILKIAILAIGFALGLLAGERAKAAELGMNVLSRHSAYNDFYNNENPGLYYKSGNDGWFYTGGFYRNSYDRWSYHAGVGYSWQHTRELSTAVNVGIVTGYGWAVAPTLAPSVAYRFDTKRSARVLFVPKVPGVTNAAVVSLSFEGEF